MSCPTSNEKNAIQSPRKPSTGKKKRNGQAKMLSTAKKKNEPLTEGNNNNDETIKPLSADVKMYGHSVHKVSNNGLPPTIEGLDMPDLNLLLSETPGLQPTTTIPKGTKISMPKENVETIKTSPKPNPQIPAKIQGIQRLLANETSVSLKNIETAIKSMPNLDFSVDSPPPLAPLRKSMGNKKATEIKVSPIASKESESGSESLIDNKTTSETDKNTKKKQATPRPKTLSAKQKSVSPKKKPAVKTNSKPAITPTPTKKSPPVKSNEKKKKVVKSDNTKHDPEDDIQLTDGLAADCEHLIERCLKVYKLNFETFCDIWKQMSFVRIFHERASGAELAEFSEEAIFLAKSYMLSGSANFEIRVAGLFLVYAFLNLQPYEDFAALRLTPDDVPQVKALEMEARRQRRTDVLYILGHVLISGPCQFHVTAREVGLELPLKKYFDGTVHTLDSGLGVLKKTHESVSLLKNLVQLEDKLQSIKQKIAERMMNQNMFTTKHIAWQLSWELGQLIPGSSRKLNTNCKYMSISEDAKNESPAPTPEPCQSRGELLSSIKQKAMINVVEPMRHLTGVEERHRDISPPAPKSNTTGESVTERSPYKGKGKGKGKGKKGRGPAAALQALCTEPEEEAPPYIPVDITPPITSQNRDLPVLDLTDECNKTTKTPQATAKRKRSKSNQVVQLQLHQKPNDDTETVNHEQIGETTPQNDDISPPAKVLQQDDETKPPTEELFPRLTVDPPPSDKIAPRKRTYSRIQSSGMKKQNSNEGIPLSEIMSKEVVEAELDRTNVSHNNLLNIIHKMTEDNSQTDDNKSIVGDPQNVMPLTSQNEDLPIKDDTIPKILIQNENIQAEFIDECCSENNKNENNSMLVKDELGEKTTQEIKEVKETNEELGTGIIRVPPKKRRAVLQKDNNAKILSNEDKADVTSKTGTKKSVTKDPNKSPGVFKKRILMSPTTSRQTNPEVSPARSKQIGTKSPNVSKKHGTDSPVESPKKTPKASKESGDKNPAVTKEGLKRSPRLSMHSDSKNDRVEPDAPSCAPSIAQIAARRMRAEKRQLKKMRVKSRFKKMGMLSIANFDESKDD